ncbi:MAG TPA: type I-B CRISPR-associated protein Cas8b1/Cst1 [Dehalococcoidia bacterium]|nr:type I-B CRISPR-associated protein Cas8b1/Cst1 [Dehalococcoidia bacterium]
MEKDTDAPAGLRWTGHPLVDHGIAALTAFAGRRSPEVLTWEDLDRFVDFAQRHYLSSDMSKTLGTLFTINSFLNPSFKSDERKRERIGEAVGAFRREGDASLGPCTFCGRPSVRVLHRDDVPMLLGRSIVNFYPGGRPGLPTCGLCQTSLHGLVLGAPRCSGRVLVVQADDADFTLRLVGKWVHDCMRYASLEQEGGEAPKISRPRTRVVEALSTVQAEVDSERAFVGVESGLVAYSLRNGQGPNIEVCTLPSSVVGFLHKARTQRTSLTWGAIERQAWERVKRDTSAADLPADERLQHQNYLYEDLFRLPDESARFIRIYFLRNAAGLVRSGDTRLEYQSVREANLVNWDLTRLFLQEVLGMEQARIEAIRSLGDRLAEEITEDNHRRLFQRAYSAKRPGEVRQLLLSADLERVRRSASPMLTLEDYLNVFEDGEEMARVDWRLAWDLVLIRLIEQLHAEGWLARNKEVVQAVEQGDDMAPEDTAD